MTGPAHRLVVRGGDRVAATGRVVHMADGVWLDLARISDLVFRPGPWRSERSVWLVGADLPPERTAPPFRTRVVGVWHDDVIGLESWSAAPAPRPQGPLLALPAPPGGWDTSTDDHHIEDAAQLRDSGLIVRESWLRTPEGALVLRVAAADPDAVEIVLGPRLPGRLCVVRSRYSKAQVDDVESMVDRHAQDWGFEHWSTGNLDPWCQPHADASLTRVGDDLAAWADTLPEGLLTLDPAIVPA